MTDISICPICGKEMTVVGNTTKHYECFNESEVAMTDNREGVDKRWYCSPEDKIRADERRKVALRVDAHLWMDGNKREYVCINVPSLRKYIDGIIHEKKVDNGQPRA